MHPKDAEGIANSVDPDQTAPPGAVWSWSALFAQTCLSENFGSLRYCKIHKYLIIRKFAVIIVKFIQGDRRVMHPNDAEGIANSVDPDQTAPEQSDLGLHCLPRPICLKTWDHYRNCNFSKFIDRSGLLLLWILNEPGHEKTSYVISEQQRRRSACACAQSDQRLYNKGADQPAHPRSLIITLLSTA